MSAKAKTVTVSTRNGTMDAELRHTMPGGKLAVTRLKGWWTITHMPSGLALYTSHFVTLKAIREMAKTLDKLNWDFTYPWEIPFKTYIAYKQFNIDHGMPVSKRPKREMYPDDFVARLEERLKQVSAADASR